MKTQKFFMIGLIFLMILISGCATTSCIPVTPTAKYPSSDSSYGVVVIGGEAMKAYPNPFQDLEVNKTSKVRFDVMINGNTAIESVCSK